MAQVTLLSGVSVEERETPVELKFETTLPQSLIIVDANSGVVYTFDHEGDIVEIDDAKYEALNVICAVYSEE